MRNRVERLRIWLLGSAVFLMLVIAAFIGSARYMSHLRLKLPEKLGMNIVRETDGYTYSQSVQGRTVYTIHAAKAVEHTDGKIALHDVSVILYGQKGDRHDRIYGDEFEYDTNAGLVRATGLVHMDLQAAEADEVAGGRRAREGAGKAGGRSEASGNSSGGRPSRGKAAADGKVLHVTTSGLVYLQRLGVAATSEPIEFEIGAMTGHATGADYSSDTGMLMLHSAVSMSGMARKQPVLLTAATAELDNRNRQAFLSDAKYVSNGRTVEAEQATLHTRADGTLERVEAQGKVTADADGATASCDRADVVLNAASEPQTAVLTGAVQYSADRPLRQARGQAEAATIVFDAHGAPEHAVFTGAVRMTERTRATQAAKEPWSVRDLMAGRVEAMLAAVGTGKAQLRDVEATVSPRLAMVNNGSLASSGGEGRTEISADDLKAHLVGGDGARETPQLDTMQGRGHAVVHQLDVDGLEQTSMGDDLDARFRLGAFTKQPASGSGKTAGMAGAAVGALAPGLLVSAVQAGHVVVTRRVPAKAGGKPGGAAGSGAGSGKAGAQEDVQRATAERAAYDGDLDRMTLTGSVRLTDAEDVLWASQVTLEHRTGDAEAEGAVKVDYARGEGSQGAAGEPAHVLADRAELHHATDVGMFFGKPVRLWQGGSQVQAPVVEFSRASQRLVARGDVSSGAPGVAQTAEVHTVLVSNGEDRPETRAGSSTTSGGVAKTSEDKNGAARDSPEVMRIASGGLVYSGVLRQADFTGGVRAESVDGTVRAGEATAYLQQAGTAGTGASLSGRVERMVATGTVEIDQPGLRATGERLLYTAGDDLYVLTGDSKDPPRATDARGTTTTGSALRFHRGTRRGDDSVEVMGTTAGESGGRVRTDSRVLHDSGLKLDEGGKTSGDVKTGQARR